MQLLARGSPSEHAGVAAAAATSADAVVRRTPTSPMRWIRNHPVLLDWGVALGVLGMSAAWLIRQSAYGRAPALEFALALGLSVPLAFRRRSPTGVFVVIAGAAFVQWAANVPPRPQDIAILIASYTVAAYGRRGEAIAATAVVLSGVVMAVARWKVERFEGALIAPVALAMAALVLGDDLRNRRAYLAELEERARRLERDQEQQTIAAVAAERASIARELHDVVAHNLSVMVVQADAAAVAIDDRPDQARAAMAAVGSTGRQALAEMRRLLGVMRPSSTAGGGGGRTPQPGVAQLEQLIDGVRRAGLPVELTETGSETSLPTGMELVVYRIVQEALTNTLKHAGVGVGTRVELRYGPDSVVVHVEDDGSRAHRVVVNDQAGQGLLGMRERAAMYGGVVTTGPRTQGGFGVTARFPLGSTA